MSSTPSSRPRTRVDEIADSYFDAFIALSPMTATYLGIPGGEEELDDFSPAGHAAQSDLRKRTLAALADVRVADAVDAVTLDAMTERLGLAEEMYAAGLDEMSLNVIGSPLQSIREVVDLMAVETDEDWETIAVRLTKMPAALEQWHESLLSAAERDAVAAQRQVREAMAQAERLVADDGYFTTLVAEATAGGKPLRDATARRLAAGAEAARAGYADTIRRLHEDVLPKAPEDDAFGRERYELASRSFIGAAIDLEETYAWGQDELARITSDMQDIARDLVGGGIDEAVDALDSDPAYLLEGTDALRAWMQERADESISALHGSHFDIPEPIRRIECRIAPTTTGGIYYTGPSEDFTRPGRMWWSVPEGVTRFGTWRELTTVYHEGVPGHHLQVAQAIYRADLLNKWRAMMSWTSGHGEGWALYAERLMDELGFMSDPGNRLGFLDAQSLRAARVVLDIGIHCGFRAPAEVGGGAWTYDKAWRFLTNHAHMPEEMLRFELNRYLGWPGQAPSYKVGERLWLDLRDQVRAREGADFSLPAFHARSLDLGGVGLDTLRRAVLG